MNPDFGTIIWNVLFEPFTEEIKTAIVDDINNVVKYDPRINVDSVEVTQYDHGIQVTLSLTYIPSDQTGLMKMRFDQTSNSATLV